jgi:hypothetical protein
VFIPGDIPVKLTSLLVGTLCAACASERAVVAVFAKLAMGIDLHRLCREPPVHKVEMMCCFVDKKRTRELLEPVPSPEIGCTVKDIQIIIEVD